MKRLSKRLINATHCKWLKVCDPWRSGIRSSRSSFKLGKFRKLKERSKKRRKNENENELSEKLIRSDTTKMRRRNVKLRISSRTY